MMISRRAFLALAASVLAVPFGLGMKKRRRKGSTALYASTGVYPSTTIYPGT